MNAGNLPETSADLLGQLDALYREVRETDKVDEELFSRINQIVIKMQVTICHYDNSPLLRKKLNPQIDENLEQLKQIEKGSKGYNASFILAKIKKIFKSLSLLNADPELSKAIVDADVSLIAQKVNNFLSANTLKDDEVIAMKKDLIDHFIRQNKLKEAWELTFALFPQVGAPHEIFLDQCLERNCLLEAVPFVAALEEEAAEHCLWLIVSQFTEQISSEKTFTIKLAAFVQQMIDAGANPAKGLRWIKTFFPEVLQTLIFNGADPDLIKNELRRMGYHHRLPVVEEALNIRTAVVKEIEQEHLEELTKEQSLKTLPVEVLGVINAYNTPDEMRQEVVRRCQVIAEDTKKRT